RIPRPANRARAVAWTDRREVARARPLAQRPGPLPACARRPRPHTSTDTRACRAAPADRCLLRSRGFHVLVCAAGPRGPSRNGAPLSGGMQRADHALWRASPAVTGRWHLVAFLLPGGA